MYKEQYGEYAYWCKRQVFQPRQPEVILICIALNL